MESTRLEKKPTIEREQLSLISHSPIVPTTLVLALKPDRLMTVASEPQRNRPGNVATSQATTPDLNQVPTSYFFVRQRETPSA